MRLFRNCRDEYGDYVEVWHCPMPPESSAYRVLRQEWKKEYTERHVYEWENA